MKLREPSILRSALAMMSVRLVLQQIGLALAVFLLFMLWLRMPDASGLEVAGSVLLAVMVVAVAGAGESVLMLRLVDRLRTRSGLLRGTLLLAVAVALWLVWNAMLNSASEHDSLRAGYWNSQLPHGLRYYFTYSRIYQWLEWFWSVLAWVGAGLLVMLVFAGAASPRPMRAVTCFARSLPCWVVLLLGAAVANRVTSSVMGWTPGHGLRREMLSLVLRLSFVVLLDGLMVCGLLAVVAACIRRVDLDAAGTQSKPVGTPAESQPRTVDNP